MAIGVGASLIAIEPLRARAAFEARRGGAAVDRRAASSTP